MTKGEAILEMQKGKKVTHTYFTDDEWISCYDGKVIDEIGMKLNWEEFWAHRQSPAFDKDWSLYV